MSGAPIKRHAGNDHIRVLLTFLVLFHHVALAYGGSGSWYWREEQDFSNLYLVAFNAINQSFFMGFFFLLAGYYTAQSFSRKGAARFLGARFRRLGLPLLAYFFLLSPLTVAVAQAGLTNEVWLLAYSRFVEFDLEPGPLWFALALLILSVCHVVWTSARAAPDALQQGRAAVFPLVAPDLPGFTSLAALALGLGLLSFLLRLYIPVGETVLWLQLGYFPCYVFLYFAGCAAARGRVLERVCWRQVWPWALTSAACLASLPFALHGAFGTGSFNGGPSLNALYYALWDPFTGFGIMLVLLWAMNRWGSRENPVGRFLARRAYAIYVVHPPLVVAASVLFAGVVLPASLKFVAVGLLASLLCVAVASLLLCLPGVRRVL